MGRVTEEFKSLGDKGHNKWTLAAMVIKAGCQWFIVLPILALIALYFGLVNPESLGTLIEKVGNAFKR